MKSLQTGQGENPPGGSMTYGRVSRHCIGGDHAGRRIDNYLIGLLKGVPKSYIYRIIRSGQVRINGCRIKPSKRLHAGEEIRVPPFRVRRPASSLLRVSSRDRRLIESNVIYEDEWFVVLNKPSGLPVHAGSRHNFGVAEMFHRIRSDRLLLAHRLDCETSGCLIFARNRTALFEVHRAFRQQQVRKAYLALLAGHNDRNLRRVEAPLAVKRRYEGAMARVDYAEGRPALTDFEIVEEFKRWMLVRAFPVTGRMHQVRVHAAYCGHPVAGDRRYGDFKANRSLVKTGLERLFLHAERLAFTACGRQYDFTAPLPKQLFEVLDALRR